MLCVTNLLLAARLLYGFNYGITYGLGNVFVNQLSPKEYKGIAGAIAAAGSRIGLLISFSLGFGLPPDGETSNWWRLMVILPGILSFISFLLLTFVFRNDSPFYVYAKTNGNEVETKKML